jgi:hypothetical protein
MRLAKIRVWTRLSIEFRTDVAKPNMVKGNRAGDTTKRLRTSRLSQAEATMPYQILKV